MLCRKACLILPMHYQSFNVNAEVSVEYRMYLPLTVFYLSVKYCTFKLLTKKKKKYWGFLSGQVHVREKRCEMYFLVVWWSLISWNLSRKRWTVIIVIKSWQIDSSLYGITVQSQCWVVTEKRAMLSGCALCCVFIWWCGGFLFVFFGFFLGGLFVFFVLFWFCVFWWGFCCCFFVWSFFVK